MGSSYSIDDMHILCLFLFGLKLAISYCNLICFFEKNDFLCNVFTFQYVL